jgi:dolichyl-diphosphooligosaccharide--protein glycosyltransferase
MVDVEDAVAQLLDERPDMEDTLRELLRADQDGTWTFHDIDVDSGTFGEIVARDIVEDQGEGYHLVDPEAVRVALGEEAPSNAKNTSRANVVPSVSDLGGWHIDRDRRRHIAALGAVLGLVLLMRVVFIYPMVFRDADLVLPGNDPYRYMWMVEQLITGPLSAWNPADLGRISETTKTGDTLLIVTLWWFIAPFGEELLGIGIVWYPVVAGVVTGYLVYRISCSLTDNRKIGLMSGILLAITPAHGFRTALGFADHHAFDYVWVAMTALAVISLVRYVDDSESPRLSWIDDWRIWTRIIGLGIGTAGIVLSWRGGPLFLLPLAFAVWAQTKVDLRSGTDPLRRILPVAIGVGIGGVVALLSHVTLGWLPLYRWVTPLLLALGALTVGSVTAAVARVDRGVVEAMAGEFILLSGLLGSAFVFVPTLSSRLQKLISYAQRTGSSRIGETYSIISSDLGLFVGPLLFLGFPIVLALATMIWASLARDIRTKPEWIMALSFGWGFLIFALIQNRFTGGLTLFVSVFGAIGFFQIAAWVDVLPASPYAVLTDSSDTISVSLQDRKTLRALLVLFVLVGSLSVISTPIKQSQIAFSDQQYETATFLERYSDENDLSYPENNVFTSRGKYNAYNTIVSGQAEHYGLVWRHYQDFLVSNDSQQWYERFNEDVGFVLVKYRFGNVSADRLRAHLGARWGGYNDSWNGVSHYRAIYASEDGSTKVYRLVPGARLNGTGPVNETVTAQTDVSVSGHTFTYAKRVRTDDRGQFTMVVPYPGKYQILNSTVEVSERAVMNGGNLSVGQVSKS